MFANRNRDCSTRVFDEWSFCGYRGGLQECVIVEPVPRSGDLTDEGRGGCRALFRRPLVCVPLLSPLILQTLWCQIHVRVRRVLVKDDKTNAYLEYTQRLSDTGWSKRGAACSTALLTTPPKAAPRRMLGQRTP